MIAPNPGVAPAPLRETASGGETLARDARAAHRRPARPATRRFVFDEVDAGIGGHTARAVGEQLRALGDGRQVVCITHLPQIASLAAALPDREVGARASAPARRATSSPEKEVVDELCRMLGADADDAGARKHAEELLAAAKPVSPARPSSI